MDEMTKRLYATNDVAVWAEEFAKVAKRNYGVDLDEGWLIGWFANAIENDKMHTRQHRERPQDGEVVVLPRGALFEFLGEMAMPPWTDERGRVIGGGINCAAIASRLVEWVDGHDLTGCVDA